MTASPAAASTAPAVTPDDERPIADPPREPTKAGIRRAKELFNEGAALAQKGDLAGAFRAFRGSYEQDGGVEALANMAVVERALGRPRAAAEHLDAAMARLPFEQAEQMVEVKRRLAEISKEITVLKLHILAEGSQVYVDDRGLGAGPMERTVYLDPGDHMVLVRLAGTVVRRPVQATKGAVKEVKVTDEDALPQGPVAAPPPAGEPGDFAGISPRWWFLGIGSLAFAVTGLTGLGVYVRAHDARTTLDRQIAQLGGSCGALPAKGFVDDCHARDQEAGNEIIGSVVGSTGATLLTGLWLGALWADLADRSAQAKARTVSVSVTPALGGITIQGHF